VGDPHRPHHPQHGRRARGLPARRRIATSGLLAKPAITSLGNLSKWAFLLCFAGVGLNFDLRELARAGLRPLVVAALGSSWWPPAHSGWCC